MAPRMEPEGDVPIRQRRIGGRQLACPQVPPAQQAVDRSCGDARLELADRIRPEVLGPPGYEHRPRGDERDQLVLVDGKLVPMPGVLEEVARHPVVFAGAAYVVDRLPDVVTVKLRAALARAA